MSCGGGEDAYMAAGRLGPTPCPMPAAATGAGGSGPLVVVTDSDEHIELTSGRKVDDEHGRTRHWHGVRAGSAESLAY